MTTVICIFTQFNLIQLIAEKKSKMEERMNTSVFPLRDLKGSGVLINSCAAKRPNKLFWGFLFI